MMLLQYRPSLQELRRKYENNQKQIFRIKKRFYNYRNIRNCNNYQFNNFNNKVAIW